MVSHTSLGAARRLAWHGGSPQHSDQLSLNLHARRKCSGKVIPRGSQDNRIDFLSRFVSKGRIWPCNLQDAELPYGVLAVS